MSGGIKLDKLANSGSTLPFFLQRRIQFREGISDDSTAATSYTYNNSKNKKKRPANEEKVQVDANGFRGASYELFPADRLQDMMKWSRVSAIGPGLSNLGNTCFLNSVMQCLTYTPPLANYMLCGEHTKGCRVEGFCLTCELARHFQRAMGSKGGDQRVISPTGTVGNLKSIAKHMRVGRQEDSHEFLRFVIEGMQKNLLTSSNASKVDVRIKETTLVHQVFGGYLQSRVKCLTCKQVSSTFDAFLDMSLDVRSADSVTRAMTQFAQAERLSKANRYRCEQCKNLSDADKSMCIYTAPNIMTIHLKRFHMSPYGETNKINKHIEFNTELKVKEAKTGRELEYSLYAVLVHEGHTCNSGHYHAFVKGSNGIWYSMNDSSVHQVSLATVLKQRAYLLFYSRNVEKETGKVEEMMPFVDVPVPVTKKVKVDKPVLQEDPVVMKSEVIEKVIEKIVKSEPITNINNIVDEELVISNSMWHLTAINQFKISNFQLSTNNKDDDENDTIKSTWRVEKVGRIN